MNVMIDWINNFIKGYITPEFIRIISVDKTIHGLHYVILETWKKNSPNTNNNKIYENVISTWENLQLS